MSESDHGNKSVPEEAAPRPKKRSFVWQFFEQLDLLRVRCYLCLHEQNYQGTTGNILRHMKSKHDVDLTIRGRQDPENQQRIQKLCVDAAAVSGNEIKIECYEPKIIKPAKKRKHSVDNRYNANACQENEERVYPEEVYVMSEDHFYMNEDSMAIIESEKLAEDIHKNKSQLEDARIKAETQYFREKAGYYKLLKYLTALKAKKIKIELLTSIDNTIV